VDGEWRRAAVSAMFVVGWFRFKEV